MVGFFVGFDKKVANRVGTGEKVVAFKQQIDTIKRQGNIVSFDNNEKIQLFVQNDVEGKEKRMDVIANSRKK